MLHLETDSGDQSTSLGTVIIEEEENYASSVEEQDSGVYYWNYRK